MSRPTELTEERSKAICDHLKVDKNLDAACAVARITSHTVRNWRKQGERDILADLDTPHSRFLLDYNAAIAIPHNSARSVMESLLTSADPRIQYMAAEFVLTHQYKDWGYTKRVEQSGPDGIPIQHEHATLTDDERKRRIADLYLRTGNRELASPDDAGGSGAT